MSATPTPAPNSALPALARGTATGAMPWSREAVSEHQARSLLLLRAFETAAPPAPTWSAQDADWAGRVARASLGAALSPLPYLHERARHALARLLPREPAAARLLAARFSAPLWSAVALGLGAVAGIAIDQIGPERQINLLAPPIWALVTWNLVVYAAIGVQALGSAVRRGPPVAGLWRRLLQRAWQPRAPAAGPLQTFAGQWAATSSALQASRAALLLHLAAAALALGLIAGLYLRGLVLDYRAGWQSTFLGAQTVQSALSLLLAPARAATGIELPRAEQVLPGEPARGPAAPWLHLYAATLVLLVVLPRAVLAAGALWRVRRLSRALPLDLTDGYFARLLAQAGRGSATAWVLPHGAALSAPAALALRTRLETRHPNGLTLTVAEPIGHGDEDDARRCTPPPGTTLVLLHADLAATPEDEVHGRCLATLARTAPATERLLAVDEQGFVRRNTAWPERAAERRGAWVELARRHGVAILD